MKLMNEDWHARPRWPGYMCDALPGWLGYMLFPFQLVADFAEQQNIFWRRWCNFCGLLAES